MSKPLHIPATSGQTPGAKPRTNIDLHCLWGSFRLSNIKDESRWAVSLAIVLTIAAFIYLTSIISPPSLMDDTDAVEAQIARTMLSSGDWVTARLDGGKYLEKSPLSWWLTAIGYKLFGG